ncbi:hypothetical protein [Acetobacter malorum]|uniref:hypothetical protein n=1 Tax=Acetobacter malorum TaxID=178901 RepID=UPI000A49243D|nr:hypothetical protein [Acetobacter malorum]
MKRSWKPLPKSLKKIALLAAIYAVLGTILAIGVSASERHQMCPSQAKGTLACLNYLHSP